MSRCTIVFLVAVAVASFSGAVAAQTANAPLAVGSHVPSPRRITYVAPQFEPDASGVVILELVIAPDGKVARARSKSVQSSMAARAVDAALQWRYEVTTYQGQPAWLVMHVMVRPHALPAALEDGPSRASNVADPRPFRIYIGGHMTDVAPADVTVASFEGPPEATRRQTGNRQADNSQYSSLFKRLELTTPLTQPTRRSALSCGTLLIDVKTTQGQVRKALILRSDGTVADADHPTIVYRQSFSPCEGLRR